MSKLAIVLCATTFFASITADRLSKCDRISVARLINHAKRCIHLRIVNIRQQMSNIGLQPSKNNFDIIEEFKKNITKDIEVARSFIRSIVDDNVKTSFSKTECRSYFVDYEKAAQDVLSKLDACISSAWKAMLTELKEADKTATKALEELRNLTMRANMHRDCHSIKKFVDNISQDVSDRTAQALCSNEKLSSGVKIREVVHAETPYNDFVKQGHDLIDKTIICVNRPYDHHS